MTITRTQDEIAERLRGLLHGATWSGEALVLFSQLAYAHALPFLQPGITEAEWEETRRDTMARDVRTQLLDYLSFAWEKATHHRGVSGRLSISKLTGWLWLLGDDEAVAFLADDANYPMYGCPLLAFVAKRYDAPIPDTAAVRNMIDGKPCAPGCASCVGVVPKVGP